MEQNSNKNQPQEFYTTLLSRALAELDSLAIGSQKPVMVCGPLRGKPGDNIDENLHTLQNKIGEIAQKEIVFDQTKYKESELEDAPHEYDLKMEAFYRGIIASGKLQKIYVLPGWESSEGTKKEISYATEANVPIEYL